MKYCPIIIAICGTMLLASQLCTSAGSTSPNSAYRTGDVMNVRTVPSQDSMTGGAFLQASATHDIEAVVSKLDSTNADESLAEFRPVDNSQYWIAVIQILTALVLGGTGYISYREYILKKRPILAFGLGERTNGLHIYLSLKNIAKTDAKALVHVRIFSNGSESWLLDRAYSGAVLWNAAVGQRVEGHKDLNFLMPASRASHITELSIEIQVCYREWSRRRRCLVGRPYHAPSQRWDYYHNPPRFVPVITSDNESPDFSCISSKKQDS